jgi:hypothetical protein
MRHALIPIHLIQDARAAAGTPVERQTVDAPAELPPAVEPRPRRLAALFHRARALVLRTS